MVNLHEYLGGIATSIAEARLMSDLKSLQIAEQFAKHDLLKHFSIPRFKAQNIELTIPVAIAEIENSYDKTYEPIDNIEFNSQTYTVLKDISKVSTFDRKTSTIIRSFIAEETDILEKNLKSGTEQNSSVQQYAMRISERFLAVYPQKIEHATLSKHLFTELQPLINTKQVAKQLTKVIVEAHKLNEIKPENIVQIKMTLNEEGLEWFTSENDNGTIESKLLPE